MEPVSVPDFLHFVGRGGSVGTELNTKVEEGLVGDSNFAVDENIKWLLPEPLHVE